MDITIDRFIYKNRACPPDFFRWVPRANFSIELNEVGTSIKKPTPFILYDHLKIFLVSRKTSSDKRRDGSYPRKYVNTPSSGVVCNSLFNHIFFLITKK